MHALELVSDKHASSRLIQWRYIVLLLASLVNVVSYTDRTNLSLAIIPMSAELHFDKAAIGAALSAFYIGYAMTQILGGLLATHYGAKPVLLAGVCLWSFATVITPLAAGTSVTALVFVRVLLGIGEGVCLPTVHALMSRWVPKAERATATTLTASGQFMGTVIALCCAPLAEYWWPSVFYIFGIAGFVWCGTFMLLATSEPDSHPFISAAELEGIRASRGFGSSDSASSDSARSDSARSDCASSHSASSAGVGGSRSDHHHSNGVVTATGGQQRLRLGSAPRAQLCAVPWRRLVCHPAAIAILAAHSTHNWGWYLLANWLPLFLTEQGLSLKAAGLMAIWPFVGAFVCSNLSGAVVDRLLIARCRLRVGTARKIIEATAKLGPMLAFIVLGLTTRLPPGDSHFGRAAESTRNASDAYSGAHHPAGAEHGDASGVHAPGPVLSTALAVAAIAIGACGQAGFLANILDVAPRHAGTLLGVSNTFATFPGILCNLAAGFMMQQGLGWPPIFFLSATISFVGLCTFVTLAQGEAQGDM